MIVEFFEIFDCQVNTREFEKNRVRRRIYQGRQSASDRRAISEFFGDFDTIRTAYHTSRRLQAV